MSKLFSPIKLAGLELANRIVVSPMCQYSADDGCATDWHIEPSRHAGEFRRRPAGRRGDPRRAPRPHHPRLRRALFRRQRGGDAAGDRPSAGAIGTAKLGIQLAHAGRKASAQRPWEGGGPLQAGAGPVADASRRRRSRSATAGTCRARRRLDDIARVRDAFVNSAKRAVRIGFDAIELHYAHGYLGAFVPVAGLQQAHRPVRRLAGEPHAVRPRDRARGARGGAEERSRSARASPAATGATTASRRTTRWPIRKALKADGLDFIDVSSGGVTADTRNPTEPGYNVPIAERVKSEAGIATRVVGLIVTPEQAEAIVAEGKADMVAMARAMLDDPRWGWHAGAGARRRGGARAAVSARRRRSSGRRPRSAPRA